MSAPEPQATPTLADCDAALARLPRLFRHSEAAGRWHPLAAWLRHYRLQQRHAALERAAAEVIDDV